MTKCSSGLQLIKATVSAINLNTVPAVTWEVDVKQIRCASMFFYSSFRLPVDLAGSSTLDQISSPPMNIPEQHTFLVSCRPPNRPPGQQEVGSKNSFLHVQLIDVLKLFMGVLFDFSLPSCRGVWPRRKPALYRGTKPHVSVRWNQQHLQLNTSFPGIVTGRSTTLMKLDGVGDIVSVQLSSGSCRYCFVVVNSLLRLPNSHIAKGLSPFSPDISAPYQTSAASPSHSSPSFSCQDGPLVKWVSGCNKWLYSDGRMDTGDERGLSLTSQFYSHFPADLLLPSFPTQRQCLVCLRVMVQKVLQELKLYYG